MNESTQSAATNRNSSSGRQAEVARKTVETEIHVRLGLDGELDSSSSSTIDVPDGFFAHMLDALTRHSGLVAEIEATGDTHIDLHHSVEDTGIAIGEALKSALGDHRGIVRFGHAYAPLDEALARAVVDLSGRGSFHFDLPAGLEHAWVTPSFPLTLVTDFFGALADRGRFTLHLDVVRGRNPHHVAEACFKAVAIALRQAVAHRPMAGGGLEASVPSTKGTLDA